MQGKVSDIEGVRRPLGDPHVIPGEDEVAALRVAGLAVFHIKFKCALSCPFFRVITAMGGYDLLGRAEFLDGCGGVLPVLCDVLEDIVSVLDLYRM